MTAGHFNELSNKNLRKLSQLCASLLSAGISLPTKYCYLPIPPPLISDKPSIASLFNLPGPPLSVPTLPRRFREPVVPSNASEDFTLSDSVINLSDAVITPIEASVLEKGLTFCPQPRFDHFALVKDTLTFARNLRLKCFFSNNEYNIDPNKVVDSSVAQFTPPSQWEPPPLPPHHPLELYISFVLASVSSTNFANSLPRTSNLSLDEKLALKRLRKREDIIILPADKGSTTVVQNLTDYVVEAERQLGDSVTYQPLNEDPTDDYTKEIAHFLQDFGPTEGLNEATIKTLIPLEPRTPSFHLLPKIHKPGNPGRPIVASFNSPTERISAFVDANLKSLVSSLPSYIKDSYDFLEKLRSLPSPLPTNTILVTIDAVSLYTNIPENLGIEALEYFLNQRPQHTPSTRFLSHLAHLVLNKNYFRFGNNYYKQIRGTAMGTRMAPSYANLCMGKLEETFMASQPLQPLCWYRFIDDIFMLWIHGEVALSQFLDRLNDQFTIKFTWEISDRQVTFLDVEVYLEHGNLRTDVHIKPTNKQQYLHNSSCHPPHVKRSLPHSLAVRGHRICSNDRDLTKYCDRLTKAFVSRGYSYEKVRKQIKRHQASNVRSTNHKDTPLLVTQYHPGLSKLNGILRSGFNILQSSVSTQGLLVAPPRTAFRRPPNLRNLLVHTDLKTHGNPISPTGSYPCNRARCKTCPIHTISTTFHSHKFGISYPILGTNNCLTRNIIYQLRCTQCQAEYIGLSTNPLAIRMSGHRQNCKNHDPDKPISAHADSHSLEFDNCFSTRVVRSLPSTCDPSELRRWEFAHMLVTGSRLPPNLNRR